MSRANSYPPDQDSSSEDDSWRPWRSHRRLVHRSQQNSHYRHQQDQQSDPLREELERDLHTNQPGIFSYQTSRTALLQSMDIGVDTALYQEGHSSLPVDGTRSMSSRPFFGTSNELDELSPINARGFYGLASHDLGQIVMSGLAALQLNPRYSDPSEELQEPEHPAEYRPRRRREGQFPSHTWTGSGSDLDELPCRFSHQHSMQQWEAQSWVDEPWAVLGPAVSLPLTQDEAEQGLDDTAAAAADSRWSAPRSMDLEIDGDYMLLLSGSFSELDDAWRLWHEHDSSSTPE